MRTARRPVPHGETGSPQLLCCSRTNTTTRPPAFWIFAAQSVLLFVIVTPKPAPRKLPFIIALVFKPAGPIESSVASRRSFVGARIETKKVAQKQKHRREPLQWKISLFLFTQKPNREKILTSSRLRHLEQPRFFRNSPRSFVKSRGWN